MGSVFLLLIVSIFLALGAWCIFIWAVRSGQFDDIEGIKYRMLDAETEDKIKR